MKQDCKQCGGSGKLFLRTGKYFKCDICQGTGLAESNVFWELVGDAIKKARMNKDLTLRQTAINYGIDPSNLSKMERGLIKPDPEYVKVIL